ncbi:unnamed protein product [Aureobasidium uvarum]|uniref:Uncharacterized protein n=1 Tax=Aureobasidium uvarum TaxID=2773716 RepID=A0A9N8KDL9_9PEZI|nr:unnamed protein product [Aureobasidium uvarum]
MFSRRSKSRDIFRVTAIVAGSLLLLYITLHSLYDAKHQLGLQTSKGDGSLRTLKEDQDHDAQDLIDLDAVYSQDFQEDEAEASATSADPSKTAVNDTGIPIDQSNDMDDDYDTLPERIDYHEIFSLTTTNRKFIPVFTGGVGIYNPNIIPHPTDHTLWIMIAQHEQSGVEIFVSEEMTCNVGLLNDVMVCTAEPTVIPIEPSITGNCSAELAYFNARGGPRDARMYHGPDAPYIMYGSQSAYSCIGIWIEDARMLLDDFHAERFVVPKLFTHATEVQRPPPIGGMEKNFFLFWDSANKAYVHHEIHPHRVFAQLSFDGSVGPNLATYSAAKDDVCIAMYMPHLAPDMESIHQASNSLSITLCKRADPGCIPNDSNTFIFTMFHHKSYHDWHGVYEPYVMVFQRDAPFAIHAISQRPIWIHGRAELTRDTHSLLYENGKDIPAGHTEMFYITSISWKLHGQKYHGYLDDPLFLAFGIEDTRAGLIDVMAEDLFSDLGYCPGFMTR